MGRGNHGITSWGLCREHALSVIIYAMLLEVLIHERDVSGITKRRRAIQPYTLCIRWSPCVERILALLDARSHPLPNAVFVQFGEPVIVAFGKTTFMARRSVKVALRVLAGSRG